MCGGEGQLRTSGLCMGCDEDWRDDAASYMRAGAESPAYSGGMQHADSLPPVLVFLSTVVPGADMTKVSLVDASVVSCTASTVEPEYKSRLYMMHAVGGAYLTYCLARRNLRLGHTAEVHQSKCSTVLSVTSLAVRFEQRVPASVFGIPLGSASSPSTRAAALKGLVGLVAVSFSDSVALSFCDEVVFS